MKMRNLVQDYIEDSELQVRVHRIWGQLALSKGIDLSDFPASKKNRNQVSINTHISTCAQYANHVTTPLESHAGTSLHPS